MKEKDIDPARDGVPSALLQAFDSVCEELEEGAGLIPDHYKSAYLLAAGTTGLERCAERIKGHPGCKTGRCIPDAGILDTVWSEIEKEWKAEFLEDNWDAFNESFSKGDIDRDAYYAGLDNFSVTVKDWENFLIEVLLKASAFPDTSYYQSQLAKQEEDQYWALAEDAEAVMSLTVEGENILDEGMREMLSEFAGACEKAAIRVRSVYQQENGQGFKTVALRRKGHTRFFQAVAYGLKHYEHGAPPSLRPGHLAAFANVLVPGDAARIDDDSLSHEAARVLRQFKLRIPAS